MATQSIPSAATQSLPEVIPVPRGDLMTLGARLERMERGLTALHTTTEAALADVKARIADVQAARKALATCGAAVKVTQLPPAGSGPAVQARVPVGTPGSLFDTARQDAVRDGAGYQAYADSAATAALVGEGCTAEFVLAHSAQRNGHGGKRPCPAVAAGNAGCACVRSLRASWQGAQRKAQAPQAAPTAAPAPQTAPVAPVAPPVAPPAAPPPAADPMTLLADGTWLRLYRACLQRGMDDASAEAAAYAAIGLDDAADPTDAPDAPAAAPQSAPPPAAPQPAARPVPTQAAYAAIRAAFVSPAKQAYMDALYAARMNGADDPEPTAYGVDAGAAVKIARRFAGAVK